ncbi:MAG: YggS family pyridoxal phosphate-dependent enzyme [Candidatus Omnitrophica bacterium]|nr:YggS family pyridoxal phosphate-dependent enzyme [Candidatus Omnitrophota bacterium]
MIADNFKIIHEKIRAAALKIKRDPKEITLICVVKGRELIEIKEVLRLGYRQIGENRVQEALNIYKQLLGVDWHMLGHLQSNKVKDAVKIFDLIHSVDSIGLAKEINKQADRIGKVQDILLEVKTSPEESKFGFAPEKMPEATEAILKLNNIKVRGLMTIAPLTQNPTQARPYFAKLRQIRDSLDSSWVLSMGMSDDFEIAIEEGADILRIGRAIFEVKD